MNSIAVENLLFQHSFEVDQVPTTRTTFCNSSRFTHLGQEWLCRVRHTGDYLEVFLVPVDLKETKTVTYGLRVVLNDLVHNCPPKAIEMIVGGTVFGHNKAISWEQLLAKFCTNGKFTVEIVFPTLAEKHTCFAGSTLEDAVFKDVWVVFEKSDNKAMFSAFNNETSEESLTKTFKIGHRLATEENVQLLVRAMYENWLPDLMDPHAIELLQIADCYVCASIARFAVDSLKRQLTLDRFWKTAAVAVLLQVQQPTLIEKCVKFADAQPNGVNDLLNRTDVGDKDTVYGIVMAVAALHK